MTTDGTVVFVYATGDVSDAKKNLSQLFAGWSAMSPSGFFECRPQHEEQDEGPEEGAGFSFFWVLLAILVALIAALLTDKAPF